MIIYTNKHKIPFQIDEDDAEIVSHYTWNLGTKYIAAKIRTSHQYRVEKDALRDTVLRILGWRIIRVREWR